MNEKGIEDEEWLCKLFCSILIRTSNCFLHQYRVHFWMRIEISRVGETRRFLSHKVRNYFIPAMIKANTL